MKSKYNLLILICIFLVMLNCYLLWSYTKIRSEKNKLLQIKKQVELQEIVTNEKIIKEKFITGQKLNLFVIWGIDGCGSCKEKVAKSFNNYEDKFDETFQFIYLGNHRRDVKYFNVQEYFDYEVSDINEVLTIPIEIVQPIILLTNENGEVLEFYELTDMDNGNYKRFNDKIFKILSLLD